MRSSQNGAVSAAATAELSSFWRRLSISTIDGICRSLAVTRFAPFLVVASFGHDGCAGAGQNRGDRVDHQRRTGAGRRLLDQMQRGRPIDHGAQEAEQQERHGMGMFGWRHEREVAQ